MWDFLVAISNVFFEAVFWLVTIRWLWLIGLLLLAAFIIFGP
jgi:hypothetical protein